MKETENHPAQARAKLDGVNIVNVVNVYVMDRGEPVIYDNDRRARFLRDCETVTTLAAPLIGWERVQRRREGESVSPPVSVHLTLWPVFVSNTDGTIEQYGPDGTSLGLYANTGLHNRHIVFVGQILLVATEDGPVIEILPDGTQETLGTVVGGDGIAVCRP